MTADPEQFELEDLLSRVADLDFRPLESADSSLGLRAFQVLVGSFLSHAGITACHYGNVVASASIEVGASEVRVRIGDLGTVLSSWDGSLDSLYSHLTELGDSFGDTYNEDRARYGDAPWG